MPLLSEPELRERVARLAAIERPTASAGERRAAEEIAAELRGLGLEARVEEERVHGTFWWPLGVPTALAALAGIRGGRLTAAVVGAGAAAATLDDLRYGPRVLRRLLPRRRATNVVAEIGDPDAPRTVVFVAHHDAAHTGLVFHPELFRAIARRFPGIHRRAKTTPPTMWYAVHGPLLVALGALTGCRGVRGLGVALSAGFTAAMADIAARPVVPGANDNATGVAVLLSLAHELARRPNGDVRVILASTGSEESNQEGMVAFGRRHFRCLPRDSTHVVCVDTVGSPHLVLLEGEGMIGIRDYPSGFKALVRNCAEDLGVFLWPGLRFRNATDGLIALRAGFPTAMIGSVDSYKVPTHYHWPTDTPENVDYGSVADAARLCLAVVDRLARSARAGQPSPSTSRT